MREWPHPFYDWFMGQKTMRIEELRLLNLTYLIDTDFGGNKAAFAAHINKNPSYVSRWYSKSDKHKRNIGGDTARDIEKACGYQDGWLDANHALIRDNDASRTPTTAKESPRV